MDRSVAPVAAPRLAHVPALDGLRGVAVVGVLAFHLGHLRGGFLGVDLFFVLSGFLITSLLLIEHDRRGGIDLRAFWSRRFRRLLPALLVVMIAVVVYGAVALQGSELLDMRRDALATLAYGANWSAIAASRSYWATFGPPSPLEHTWSLAIEEQFYVIWPLVVAVVLAQGRGRRRPLLGVTMALTGASWLSLWMHHHPGGATNRAYYGTDTRAAALLLGASAAVVLAGRDRSPEHVGERVVRWASWPSVGFLAWAWIHAAGTDDALYVWVLPLAGIAAAVLIAQASGPSSTLFSRALAFGPLRWLGSISYGLYLWHWPVFVALSAQRTGLRGPELATLQIVVSLAAAVASSRWVEEPVRRGSLGRWRWGVLAPASVLAVAGFVVVATIGGVPHPTASSNVAAADQSTRSVRSRGGRAERVLVVGDSQVIMLAEGIRRDADSTMDVTTDGRLGCGLGPGIPVSKGQVLDNGRCGGVIDAWRASAKQGDPDLAILLAGAWDVLDQTTRGDIAVFGTAAWDEAARDGIRAALTALDPTHRQVVALTAPCFFPEGAGGGPVERGDPARVNRWNELLRGVSEEEGAEVVEFGAGFCTGREAFARSDGVHLTEGSAQAAWGWIVTQIARQATTSRRFDSPATATATPAATTIATSAGSRNLASP